MCLPLLEDGEFNVVQKLNIKLKVIVVRYRYDITLVCSFSDVILMACILLFAAQPSVAVIEHFEDAQWNHNKRNVVLLMGFQPS